MKKIILVCLCFIGLQAVAQKKINQELSKLVDIKNFVFIVSEIKKKPGFNGSSYSNMPRVNTSQLNPSTLSIEASKNLTSMVPGSSGSNRQVEYYRLSQLDGSYFTAYNIKNPSLSTDQKLDSVVYLIQKDSQLVISTAKNPSSVNEIIKKDFYVLANSSYKLKANKKTKSSQILTYTLGNGASSNKIYLEIFADGKAILQNESSPESTTYLYGHIEIPNKV
jgi:hypothetical protein